MRTAGVILDIYDDPRGLILKEKLAGAALPEKLASSELLEHEDLQQLPDRLFGLVAVNDGQVLRKYAMHDEPHLTTSIVYFLECGHLLPESTQVKVAGNLVNACAWYDVDPPDPLVKIAVMGAAMGALTAGMGALELMGAAKEGSERKRQQMDEFRRAQTSGSKVAAGNVIELTHGEDAGLQAGSDMPSHVKQTLDKRESKTKTDAKLEKQVSQHTMQLEPQDVVKKADLTGTEVMPQGTLSKSVRSEPHKRVSLPAKTAASRLAALAVSEGWSHAGDLTHESTPVREKKASYAVHALPHLRRYPLDTPELVKQASAYFDEHVTEFPLLERRVFSQSLHVQAQRLGVKVAGTFQEYAGNEYGPHIRAELLSRANGFRGTGHEVVYETLLEKQAEVDPRVMAELLKEADNATGADSAYGRPGVGFRDPYAAVYGGVKVAAEEVPEKDNYSWVSGSDYVNGFMLEAFADSGPDLDATFGEGFWESFKRDPVGIFKSMPDPQKVVLSRMASDNSGGQPLKT